MEITINSFGFQLPKELENKPRLITNKKVQLFTHPSIQTPMTWGGIRPVILFPSGAINWSNEALKTVLIHELNHIKRNDYLLHILSLLTVCVYWYNPLVWWMEKRQLLEREKACDEAVLYAGISRKKYATQLVKIARNLTVKTPMIRENALPMAKVSQTKKRVLAILSFDNQRLPFSNWGKWKYSIGFIVIFPVLAAFTPTGKAIIQAQLPLPELGQVTHLFQQKTN